MPDIVYNSPDHTATRFFLKHQLIGLCYASFYLPFSIEHQNNWDLKQEKIDGKAQILRQKNPRAFMNAKPGTLQIL